MHSKLKTNNILQFNTIHNFIRVSCGRYVIKKGNFLHLMRCDVLVTLLSSCMWCHAVWQNSTNISHEPFLPSGKKIKAVTSSIMVLCLSTRLHSAAADKTVTFPHLPHSQVTGIPNDSVNRLQPHGHSTSLGKAFCHGYPWTSKLFWMVSQPNFFIQQFVLWATHVIDMKIFHIRYRCLHVSLRTTQWW
jgi:hypothetical protein